MAQLNVPNRSRSGTVTVSNRDRSFTIEGYAKVYPAGQIVVVGSGYIPFAKIHGAYTGVPPLQLGLAAGRHALTSTGIASKEVGHFAATACVPAAHSTALGPALGKELGLDKSVARMPAINTLCTSFGHGVAYVAEQIQLDEGEGIGLVIGLDGQDWAPFEFMPRFREILNLVMEREMPMQFATLPEALDPAHPFAKSGIPTGKLLEAMAILAEEAGVTPQAVRDGIAESFRDPRLNIFTWDTAANVARAFHVTDADSVLVARESHARYFAAYDQGHLFPIMIVVPETPLRVDENPLRSPNDRLLLRGKTANDVSSGTASQMGTGAAEVVLTSAKTAKDRGLPVQAELVAYAFSQVDGHYMPLSAIAALKAACNFVSIPPNKLHLIESNEAFAALSVATLMEPDLGLIEGSRLYVPAQFNPQGGAIAIGHVMGATVGRMIAYVTRYFEIHPEAEFAAVTLCGGEGQGFAAIFRNPRHEDSDKLTLQVPRGTVAEDVIRTDPDVARMADLVRKIDLPDRTLRYLPDESVVAGIRSAVAKIKEAGHTFPENQDLQFVLSKTPGTLGVEDLLWKASLIATIRCQSAPGTYPEPVPGEPWGVIGAGNMGPGIAHVLAWTGRRVYLTDLNEELAQNGRNKIMSILYDSIGRGQLTAKEAAEILSRIHTAPSMAAAAEAVQGEGGYMRVVVEAVKEDLPLKQGIVADLLPHLDPRTKVATNSSSYAAAQVGAHMGIHFSNPVVAMKLVDVSFTEGVASDEQAYVLDVIRQMRKEVIAAKKDAPGLVYNPFFAATYFAAEKMSEVEAELGRIIGERLMTSPDDPVLQEVAQNPRPYAMALLDALYVDVIAGTPEPLSETLGRKFDLKSIAAAMRGGRMGLFLLIDSTGGPHTFVELATQMAARRGSHLAPPEAVVQQNQDWQAADAARKGGPATDKTAWGWYPEKPDKRAYAALIADRIGKVQQVLSEARIGELRAAYHQEHWARSMHMLFTMRDEGVISASDPHEVDTAVGLGLNHRVTPEAWLRAQPDISAVRQLLEGHGLPIPESLQTHHDPTSLVSIAPLLRYDSHNGKVAHIQIYRPRVANAMNEEAIHALLHNAREISGRKEVGVTVLGGSAGNLVGGADLQWFYERQRIAKALRNSGDLEGARAELAKIYDHFSKLEIDAMNLLRSDNRLLVVLAQGQNVGGGVEIAAQADILIIAEGPEGETCSFWMPEPSLGISIGYGANEELVRRIGEADARRILLTGSSKEENLFRTNEALAIGFADLRVRRDQLDRFLSDLSDDWLRVRGLMSKNDFIVQWSSRGGPKPAPSDELFEKKKLWSDRDAVQVMSLGVVPAWLEGRQRVLAERAVDAIRLGSPKAIAALNQMVDQGRAFDLREGLIHIFGTPEAEAGIAQSVGIGRATYTWPYTRAIAAEIRGITARKLAALGT